MERGISRIAVVAVAVTALAFAIAGCGGSSSSTGTETSGEASAQFHSKSNEKIVKFGTEASDTEREAADSVLQTNLKAREAADFATQCATLSQKGLENVSPSSTKSRAACTAELKKLAEPLSGTKKVRTDTLDGPIAALRIKGKEAYALYHGNDGNDYAMPMEKEAAGWKVAALVTTEL